MDDQNHMNAVRVAIGLGLLVLGIVGIVILLGQISHIHTSLVPASSLLEVVGCLLLMWAIFYWVIRPPLLELARIQRILAATVGARPVAAESPKRIRWEPREEPSKRNRRLFTVIIVLFLVAFGSPRLPVWLGSTIVAIAICTVIGFSEPGERLSDLYVGWILFCMQVQNILPMDRRRSFDFEAGGFVVLMFVFWSVNELRLARVAPSILEAYLQGDYRTAMQRASDLEDATRLSAKRLHAAALTLYHQRDFQRAEALVRRALRLQPNSRVAARLTQLLARIKIETAQFGEASQAVEASGKLGSDAIGAAKLRMLLALRQGLPAPLETLSRAPSDAVVEAWALAANGRPDEARVMLQAIEGQLRSLPAPDRAEALYYAGRAWQACGDGAAASRHFKQAVQVESDALFGHLAAECLAR